MYRSPLAGDAFARILISQSFGVNNPVAIWLVKVNQLQQQLQPPRFCPDADIEEQCDRSRATQSNHSKNGQHRFGWAADNRFAVGNDDWAFDQLWMRHHRLDQGSFIKRRIIQSQ